MKIGPLNWNLKKVFLNLFAVLASIFTNAFDENVYSVEINDFGVIFCQILAISDDITCAIDLFLVKNKQMEVAKW